jgi:hypothetical protein
MATRVTHVKRVNVYVSVDASDEQSYDVITAG